MSEPSGEAVEARSGESKAPEATPAAPPPADAHAPAGEGPRRRNRRTRRPYWGLRPRKAIRRTGMAVLSVVLVGVLALEVAWLWRIAP